MGAGPAPIQVRITRSRLKACFLPGSHGWKLSSVIFFYPWLVFGGIPETAVAGDGDATD